MYVFSGLAIFVAILAIGDSFLGIGGDGALGTIGGAANGLIGGAEGVLGGAGSKVGGMILGKGHKKVDIPFDSSEEWSSSSSHEEHQKKRKHSKGKKTGRGIDKDTGIGSRGGIATPILNLLGLTKTVCTVSYAGEALIEQIGDFAIGMNHAVRKIDHAIANYITDNIVLKAVDSIRKGHNGVVKFIVATHVGFTKFATNTIIEVYRATKAPIRELMACH